MLIRHKPAGLRRRRRRRQQRQIGVRLVWGGLLALVVVIHNPSSSDCTFVPRLVVEATQSIKEEDAPDTERDSTAAGVADAESTSGPSTVDAPTQPTERRPIVVTDDPTSVSYDWIQSNGYDDDDDDDHALRHDQRIVIDDTTLSYEPPFSRHYPMVVAQILEDYQTGDEFDPYWLVELALAHRSVWDDLLVHDDDDNDEPISALLEAGGSPNEEPNGAPRRTIEQHERHAVQLFLRAIALYDQDLSREQDAVVEGVDRPDGTTTTTTSQTAAAAAARAIPPATPHDVTLLYNYATACYCLAETYALSQQQQQQRLASTAAAPTAATRVYYQYAHDAFQTLLLVPVSPPIDTAGAPSSNAMILDAATRHDIHASWAQTCLRLGVMRLSPTDDNETEDHAASDDPSLWAQAQLIRAEQAATYFTNAIGAFRSLLLLVQQNDEVESDDASRMRDASYDAYLATSLQNFGTVLVLQGDLEAALQNQEEALSIYQRIVLSAERQPHESVAYDTIDTLQAVSELLMALADTSLQLDRFQSAKDWYKQAMEWYETYRNHVDPRSDLFGSSDYSDEDGMSSSLLSEYEVILQEYLESVAKQDHLSMDGMDEANYYDLTGETLYGRDNAYEGDLHMNIGSLYLSHGAGASGEYDVQAASHLEQAMRLYELSGEGRSENMATAKYTVSMHHLQNGNYDLSAKFYSEALDIFQHVAEVNPDGNGMMSGGDGGMPDLSSMVTPQKRKPVTQIRATSDTVSDTQHGLASSEAQDDAHPSAIQAVNVDQNGQSKGTTILVDMKLFLTQNDSIKEEL